MGPKYKILADCEMNGAVTQGTTITSDAVGAEGREATPKLDAVWRLISDLDMAYLKLIAPTGCERLQTEWSTEGITAKQARQMAAQLRELAFEADTLGEVAVDVGSGEHEIAPHRPMAAAAALEHVAMRLGPVGRLRLKARDVL